jgi:hypothetical protein
MYINKSHGAAVRRYSRAETGLHRAPPKLWPQLGGEEVRGPSSEAVSAGAVDSAAASAGGADFAAVETVTAPPVPGVQKPLRWVGKRSRDRFVAAKGVQTSPAWPWRSHLGACPAVSRGGADCRVRRPWPNRPLGC